MLIDAPSTDARLMEVPGYGWQPTPRAWEFPSHPGIVALALDVLSDELLVSEELRAETGVWRSKLDQRNGGRLPAPRIEQNRYCLDHDVEDADWAVLIPSRTPTATGSRFLKHPAVLDLLQRVFCDTPDVFSASPVEGQVQLDLDDDRDVPDISGPDADRSKADSIGTIVENVGFQSHFHALETAGAGDGWVDCVFQILRAAAAGKLSVGAEGLPLTGTSKHESAIKLAAEIARQGPEDKRRQACIEMVNMMNWDERYYLLFELIDTPLDYVLTETIDDAGLIKGCTAGKIGLDPFKSIRHVFDTLDVCNNNFQAYRGAVKAYRDGSLFADSAALLTMDVQLFLKRVLEWFAFRMDEDSLALAFETYVRFLQEGASRGQLEELIQVCRSIGECRALKVKSTLLIAQALHALDGPHGGISNAIKHLVEAQRSLPFDYHDRNLVCAEARLLAQHDPALGVLLEECGATTEQLPPAQTQVSGRVLVIGGQDRFKVRGLRAIKQAFPKVDFEWLNSDEAKSTDRVRTLVNAGRREVLLYTWVLSHSAERAARAAAEGANRRWERVRMPALAAVLREVPRVLRAA